MSFSLSLGAEKESLRCREAFRFLFLLLDAQVFALYKYTCTYTHMLCPISLSAITVL